ncbi:MAG: hypothetical protein AB7O26_10330 [Planctomycetaceae bacterium]
MTDSRVDVLRELRLRNWARANYVPSDERKPTWHPIVLDEMSRRDCEMEEIATVSRAGSRYVPLAPIEQPILHEAHPGVPDPKLLQRVSPSELRRAAESRR